MMMGSLHRSILNNNNNNNNNEKKCAVIHVKRVQVEQGSGDMKIADLKPT